MSFWDTAAKVVSPAYALKSTGFFDSLLGKTGARESQALGARSAQTINNQTNAANDYARTGYDSAQARYAPLAQTANKGYNLYADTYGLNGEDARNKAYQTYQSDPRYANAAEKTNNLLRNIIRTSASRGMGNSGATQLAMARAGLDAEDARYDKWLNGLSGFANQGVQIAGQQAGLDTGFYNGMADREIGRGQGLVQADVLSTQGAQQARTQGINNLLGIFGTGVRAMTGGWK